MVMIKDTYGRVYKLIEVDTETTLLECDKTKDKVRIRNFGWLDICFAKP